MEVTAKLFALALRVQLAKRNMEPPEFARKHGLEAKKSG